MTESRPDDARHVNNGLPPQIFQTVVYPPDIESSVTFVTVPTRSLQNRRILENPTDLFVALDLHPIERVTLDNFEDVLAEYIAAAETNTEALFRRPVQQESTEHPQTERERFRDAARYIQDLPLVPFERSPLTAAELSKIVRSGGTGVGVYIGFVLAGSTPWLLLTVPLGIVLMRATMGVGRGLETGLEKRIHELVAPKPKRHRRLRSK